MKALKSHLSKLFQCSGEIRIFWLLLLFWAIYQTPNVVAQCQCNNIGFENNSLGCWKLKHGKFLGGNAFYWSDITSTENSQHEITDLGNFDEIADCVGTNFLSQVAPGSIHSLRIGDDDTGSKASSASVKFVVTQATSVFQLQYAVVFSDPGHSSDDQPRFKVVANSDCGDYFVIADSAIPGFFSCSNGWRIKPWTTVGVNLENYIGQTVEIQFISTDCSLGAHAGYAYIDAKCVELQVDIGNYCPGDAVLTLTAPEGFSQYEWVNLSTGQTYYGQQITIQNPQGGETYQIEITSVTGCIAYLEYTLPELPPDAEIVINYLGNTSFCQGQGGILEITGSSIADIYVNGIEQTNTTIYLTPQATTHYSVLVTSTDTCVESEQAEFLLQVLPPPLVQVYASDFVVCPGDTVVLFYTPLSGVQFEWLELGILNEEQVTIVVDTTTEFSLMATSSNGCSITESITIHVIEDGMITYNIDRISVCPPGSPTGIWISIENVSHVVFSYLTYLTPTGGNADTVYNFSIANGLLTLYPYSNMVIPIEIYSGDCSVIYDTLYIDVLTELPMIELDENELFICSGDTAIINVGGNYDSISCIPPPIEINEGVVLIAPLQDIIYEIKGYIEHCIPAQANLLVHVTPRPEYMVESSDSSVCEGDIISIEVVLFGQYDVLWKHNQSDDPKQIISIDSTSTFFFEVASLTGCIVEDSILIEVLSNEWLDYILDSVEICRGTNATLSVVTEENITVFWEEINLYTNAITVSPDSSSYFQVNITTPSGCTTIKDSVYVTVMSSSVKLDVIPDTILCPGDSILVNITGEGLTGVYWEEVDTFISELYLPKGGFTYYTVRGISIDSSECPSTPLQFKIETTPQLTVEIYPSEYEYCAYDVVELSVSIGPGVDSFYWQDNGGIDSIREVVLIPNSNNSYAIVAVDIYGCQSVTEISLGQVSEALPPVYSAVSYTKCSSDTIVIDLMAENYSDIVWDGLTEYNHDTILYWESNDTVLRFTIIDSTGCLQVEDSVTVLIDNIVASYPNAIEGCLGDLELLSFPMTNVDSIYWIELDTMVYGDLNFNMIDIGQLQGVLYSSNGCLFESIIEVRLFQDGSLISQNTPIKICSGDSVLLNVLENDNLEIIWNVEGTGQEIGMNDSIWISPVSSETYTATAHIGNCVLKDTTNVIVIDRPVIATDETYQSCAGGSLNIDLECDSNTIVTWHDGWMGCNYAVVLDTSEFITFMYTDELGCWIANDSIFVLITQSPLVEFIDSNLCLVPGDIITPANNCSQCSFLWHDGSAGKEYEIPMDVRLTEVSVLISNECGQASDTAKIYYNDCSLFVPNSFSPNNDGINDTWGARSNCYYDKSDYKLCVYNRWGANLFCANDIAEVWTGENQSPGVFVWRLELYDDICKKIIKKNGSVTLVK